MYRWIWQHLPFGRAGKLVGSTLLIAATGALLWYGVFPSAEKLLPFGDVQVTDSNGPAGTVPSGPTPSGARPGSTSATPSHSGSTGASPNNQVSPRPSR